MTIAALPDAQAAAGVVLLLTSMSILFCGVLQARASLPGFWSFMYYVSPFTYWIGGIVSTVLHGRAVECSPAETLVFSPPGGMTCGEYLAPLSGKTPGVLQNPSDGESCRYCGFAVADQYLAGVDVFWADRWRNFGIVWAYIVFDVAMAIGLYYVFGVKKWDFNLKGKLFKKKN